ncbi:hypothetical protein LI091_18430, partial [Blautia sp. MSK20_18]|uniref:hypothetical protein n=1 Tax=Blautia sp. MSK20_18 TaxID=2883186 RepID=UPI002237C448
RDFTLCIGQSVIPFLSNGHGIGRLIILEVVNTFSALLTRFSIALFAARFVRFIYAIFTPGTPPEIF